MKRDDRTSQGEPDDIRTVLDALLEVRLSHGIRARRHAATTGHVKSVRKPFGGRKLTDEQLEQWLLVLRHASEHCRRHPTTSDGASMAKAVLRLENLSQLEKFTKWLERDDLDVDSAARVNGKVKPNGLGGFKLYRNGHVIDCDENGVPLPETGFKS
jgi:hypothetical protein